MGPTNIYHPFRLCYVYIHVLNTNEIFVKNLQLLGKINHNEHDLSMATKFKV